MREYAKVSYVSCLSMHSRTQCGQRDGAAVVRVVRVVTKNTITPSVANHTHNLLYKLSLQSACPCSCQLSDWALTDTSIGYAGPSSELVCAILSQAIHIMLPDISPANTAYLTGVAAAFSSHPNGVKVSVRFSLIFEIFICRKVFEDRPGPTGSSISSISKP